MFWIDHPGRVSRRAARLHERQIAEVAAGFAGSGRRSGIRIREAARTRGQGHDRRRRDATGDVDAGRHLDREFIQSLGDRIKIAVDRDRHQRTRILLCLCDGRESAGDPPVRTVSAPGLGDAARGRQDVIGVVGRRKAGRAAVGFRQVRAPFPRFRPVSLRGVLAAIARVRRARVVRDGRVNRVVSSGIWARPSVRGGVGSYGGVGVRAAAWTGNGTAAGPRANERCSDQGKPGPSHGSRVPLLGTAVKAGKNPGRSEGAKSFRALPLCCQVNGRYVLGGRRGGYVVKNLLGRHQNLDRGGGRDDARLRQRSVERRGRGSRRGCRWGISGPRDWVWTDGWRRRHWGGGHHRCRGSGRRGRLSGMHASMFGRRELPEWHLSLSRRSYEVPGDGRPSGNLRGFEQRHQRLWGLRHCLCERRDVHEWRM